MIFGPSIDYPTSSQLLDELTCGTMYNYVSSTFLNGLINYVTPLKIYLLERYETFNQDKFDKIIANKQYHTKLDCFRDDVMLLGETDGYYWVFWFDMDCSDCSIGRASKLAYTKEEMLICFEEYVKSHIESNERPKDKDVECITGYHEIPLDFLMGWLSF